jgi:hypothetical protein
MAAGDRSSGRGNHEDYHRESGVPSPYGIVTTEGGAIDEDIYCLDCGYNLRGLYGDPVRCPECGGLNELGAVTIPAPLIREALRGMEAAPTRCVGFAVLLSTMIGAGASDAAMSGGIQGVPRYCITFALVGAVGWWYHYRKMKVVFNNQPGWRQVLLQFHLVALPFILGLPALFLSVARTSYYRAGLDPVFCVFWLVAVPAVLPLLLVYRSARRRINVMQRDAAVRIAREQLRKTLHQQRRY